MITDQWSPQGAGYSPQVAEHGYLSFPERNKYLIFNGELLHGVLSGAHNAERPAPPGAKRLTFLVNWWDYKPEEPNCSLLEYSQVKGLKLMDSDELTRFRQEIDAASSQDENRAVEPVPEKDLTPQTTEPWYVYNYNLPGGAHDSLHVPRFTSEDRDRYSTFHLIWHPRWFSHVRKRYGGYPGPVALSHYASPQQNGQNVPRENPPSTQPTLNPPTGNTGRRRLTAAEARAERERRDREL